MSLTAGHGPLSAHPAGRFSAPVPAGVVYVEPHPRRIQAFIGDRTVIDTEQALLVHRPGRPLAYAFPAEVVSGLPHEPEPEAPGYVQVPWDAVERWIEEGRQLVDYPANPYHRVDCRPTRRRLTVRLDGQTLVDTDRTVILFETSLGPRLYVARDLVRTDLLRRSPTTTYCNYKGWATYWDGVIDGAVTPDVAWSYDDPLPESDQICGMLSFDPAKVDLDAELPASPTTMTGCTTECATPTRSSD